MAHSDDTQGPAPLPEARLKNPGRRERWRPPLRRLKRAALAAVLPLTGVGLLGLFCTLLVFKYRACMAEEERECAAADGLVMRDILRIKRVENDGRLVYIQHPGSAQIEQQTIRYPSTFFVADAPSDGPMWAVQKTHMYHEQCIREITFHVRSITDPNVE